MIERLEQILKEYKLSPSRFADKMGVQRSGISHILAGRNKPSYDFMVKFAEEFPEVDITWLLTGKGSMFSEDKAGTAALKADNAPADLFSSIPEKPVTKVESPNDKNSGDKEQEKDVKEEEQAVYKSKLPGNNGEIDSILILFSDGRFKRYVEE